MGVTALWQIVGSSQERRKTRARLADSAFKRPGVRSLRLGVDASLWFYHVLTVMADPDLGANAPLRTLYYRTCAMIKRGILPVFVFDGNARPPFKRGKPVCRAAPRAIETQFKTVLFHLGLPWVDAPGEAEAQLACMNEQDLIDAVLSDDSDALIFGAQTLWRNKHSAAGLSSPKKAQSRLHPFISTKVKEPTVEIYTADRILGDCGLDKGAMILIAMLAGGDYHDGVTGVGATVAHAMAKCGFGDSLLFGDSIQRRADPQAQRLYYDQWRELLKAEMATNSKGFLARKAQSAAAGIAPNFPDLTVLRNYTNPLVDPDTAPSWNQEINVGALIIDCLRPQFEWSNKRILSNIKSTLFPALLTRQLRCSALSKDGVLSSPSYDQLQLSISSTIDKIVKDKSNEADNVEGVMAYRLAVAVEAVESAVLPFLAFPDPFLHIPGSSITLEVAEPKPSDLYCSVSARALDFSTAGKTRTEAFRQTLFDKASAAQSAIEKKAERATLKLENQRPIAQRKAKVTSEKAVKAIPTRTPPRQQTKLLIAVSKPGLSTTGNTSKGKGRAVYEASDDDNHSDDFLPSLPQLILSQTNRREKTVRSTTPPRHSQTVTPPSSFPDKLSPQKRSTSIHRAEGDTIAKSDVEPVPAISKKLLTASTSLRSDPALVATSSGVAVGLAKVYEVIVLSDSDEDGKIRPRNRRIRVRRDRSTDVLKEAKRGFLDSAGAMIPVIDLSSD